MLIGKYNNSIDAKFRMTIPAKLREDLGFKCYLTIGIDRCLNIYPGSEWEGYIKQLLSFPTTDVKVREYRRRLMASSFECDVDKQGRILLPQELREYAGITKELVTVGDIDKVEVWSKEYWEERENDTSLSNVDLAEAMKVYQTGM